MTSSMAGCSCWGPRLRGKVAYLRRPLYFATLRRSTLKCSTPATRVARPPLVGSFTGVSTSGCRAARFKVTSDRPTCRTAPAMAGDLESHGEEQASHPGHEQWPNPASNDIRRSALLRLLVMAAAPVLVMWCTRTRSPAGWGVLAIAQALLCTFTIWKEQLRMHEVLFESVVKHLVPPLYKHIARTYGMTVAMVQLAALDPQRRLQQQLLETVTKAYKSDNDAQQVLFRETTNLLLSNGASIVYGNLEGTHQIVDTWSTEFVFSDWCSRERTIIWHSRSRLEQRKALSSLDRANSMEGQQQLTVVTLLVAARGVGPAPEHITGSGIVDALENLPSIRSDSLISCQVLWAPVDKDTSYTFEDLAEDYPRMKAIRSRGSGVFITHRRPGEEMLTD